MYETNPELVRLVFHPRAMITGYVDYKLDKMDSEIFFKIRWLAKTIAFKKIILKFGNYLNKNSRKNCCCAY